MMRFVLPTSFSPLALPFRAGKKMILHGSCFSEEMGQRAENAGIETSSNLFGTIYHPIPMAKVLKDALDELTECRILKRDDLFFSWDTSGAHYGMSEVAIRSKINSIRSDVRASFEQADMLVLTFGTAWLYTLKDDRVPVANCHQIPSASFHYSLSDSCEMWKAWQELLADILKAYPNIKIILTVSPVRYAKEGLVANNRSKSRLIELCHLLVEQFSGVFYFPAYEIVIDELRDYRFYKQDLVHPNEQAVDYVWDRFVEGVFDKKTRQMLEELTELNRLRFHRTRYPESKASVAHQEMVQSRMDECRKSYPGVYIKK